MEILRCWNCEDATCPCEECACLAMTMEEYGQYCKSNWMPLWDGENSGLRPELNV